MFVGHSVKNTSYENDVEVNYSAVGLVLWYRCTDDDEICRLVAQFAKFVHVRRMLLERCPRLEV